ncbi:methylmalonyl-CoA mutase family protein [Flammeovirga sp. SJP92]|uniref:methylmalonyl-CoA mutase family protein n=1 Tax=Flammeovirga sp. SJP92 TaxID=1775430 RepID=UPI000787FA41|nr:methylmalonyl-CoA mutase family protein [Flammeovirga sp. SJP92]KXX72038.1 methylmalonyl-CoA mutase [Flammeovirga sp. SJP92]
MNNTTPYKPKNKVRLVTSGSLFDGHDASINIMRRIMQSSGAEIIHLGHNRTAQEIVDCAIQEDVQGIAITSYQGGHLEYFKYIYDLLKERGAGYIGLYGGGGGTILPSEIDELHDYGIKKIYSPDDGRTMGLQGMINDILIQCDHPTGENLGKEKLQLGQKNHRNLGRIISAIENFKEDQADFIQELKVENKDKNIPVLGITGTGGAGKSSLVDELIRRFLSQSEDKTIAIISIDPSKRKTGGALLGDRIRMNAIADGRIYMRSLATRKAHQAISEHIEDVLEVVKAADFDLILLETSGIGQSGTEIVDYSDVSLYVMTPEYGAATQLEKIDMLDYADVIALNKFDKKGALDALRDVAKQYKRNHGLWELKEDDIPVYGTMASQFNDEGVNELYNKIISLLEEKSTVKFPKIEVNETSDRFHIIPPSRVRYLSEISEVVRNYNLHVKEQADIADQLFGLQKSIEILEADKNTKATLQGAFDKIKRDLDHDVFDVLEGWKAKVEAYAGDTFTYQVRGKDIKVEAKSETLSGNKISKVTLPKFTGWGDITRWVMQENVPGEFPYTAGVFPFKRQGEDPTRMFAGEGNPERTNRRFHYLSQGQPAARLSTAFDSVTLYGEDPDFRPDIYGKIGNSGVNVSCLDDAKRLYSGFDLCAPSTSVSMTINGPAAAMTAFFMNAAIDQQCEVYIKENGLGQEVKDKIASIYKGQTTPTYRGDLPPNHNGLGLMLLGVTGDQVLPLEIYNEIKKATIAKVRGTVQADILKEDQAQNTCIFSTEFSLRLMGDMQQYFTDNGIRNFYSVSISGYHIAEAGANPISQLAFTLANGFTFIEYYLNRGMKIDDFAPNFSFFFSNGVDPEYAVIGRVARRIWAKALKIKYKGSDRSQKLKYHIQTSGRSLHAQEIAFNDIRTTLQALYAIYDNCNSLHTNAYDEAITTPTEESVRRAVAIQLIINKELGLAKNENPLQGSFIIEELTDLVEEAVMMEFDRITERGGVLGAMETMYQRSKIQEESLHYETLKHNGEYPIVGVNTFLSKEGSPTIIPEEVIRSSTEEKDSQITSLENLHQHAQANAIAKLKDLQSVALANKNTFDALMEASKYCSLGQITHALFDVGGQYRRNM